MTTVLITGANRGLGLEFARQYRADGAEVIACCRRPDKCDSLQALNITLMELDVADAASIARLAVALNGKPIDILINNAGTWGGEQQRADDCPPEAMIETFKVNTVGPLLVSRALKTNLLAGRDKKLAVVTSKMGSISDSSGGVVAYRAAKAALNIVMHGVAKEWARDGIVIGILHPGWVRTDMGGPGAPLDVVQSVTGMRARIADLSPQTSGCFLDYQGREIGW